MKLLQWIISLYWSDFSLQIQKDLLNSLFYIYCFASSFLTIFTLNFWHFFIKRGFQMLQKNSSFWTENPRSTIKPFVLYFLLPLHFTRWRFKLWNTRNARVNSKNNLFENISHHLFCWLRFSTKNHLSYFWISLLV